MSKILWDLRLGRTRFYNFLPSCCCNRNKSIFIIELGLSTRWHWRHFIDRAFKLSPNTTVFRNFDLMSSFVIEFVCRQRSRSIWIWIASGSADVSFDSGQPPPPNLCLALPFRVVGINHQPVRCNGESRDITEGSARGTDIDWIDLSQMARIELSIFYDGLAECIGQQCDTFLTKFLFNICS